MDYTIYIKLTNACNLKCKHCYNAVMNNSQMMTDESVENVIKFLKNFRNKHESDKINVQLHGGEPMLYDVKKLISLVQSTSDLNLLWSITTNLVYKITPTMIKFFKMMLPYDEKPYIMTSWDKDIRFDADQEKVWTRNVKRLIKNGIEVLPIVCVTRQLISTTTPSELIDMMSSIGITHINFERITNTGNAADGSLTPTNREVDDWLFEAYKYAKDKNIYVPLFENVEDSVKGFLNGCRARQCMRTVITINPDCSIAACPNIANFTYGKLEDGLIIENEISYLYLIDCEKTKKFNCMKCLYYRYCNAECCQLQYDETGCPGLTKIYEYLVK